MSAGNASPVPDDGGLLPRRLGFWGAVGISVGVTIGSGIFRTPGVVAARVPDPFWFLAVWTVGGLVTLCGTLAVAQLARSLPETGGLYVYLREGWGRWAGFLFGWAELTLIRASALGGIATVFSEYLLRSLGRDPAAYPGQIHWIAAAAIVAAAVVNICGVRLGAGLVGVTTLVKVGCLAVMAGLALLLGGEHGASAGNWAAGGVPVEPAAFGLALISVLWAYDGWADLSFVGGEVRQGGNILPKALLAGAGAVTVIYLVVNAAYLYIQPVSAVAQSRLIAADTMSALIGPRGASFIAVAVMLSTFSAVNAVMLASPRVLFAMAADGLLFRRIAQVHPRFRTPYAAIGLASLLGVGFVLVGTFEQLADTFVLTVWPFYALAILGLFRMGRGRRTVAWIFPKKATLTLAVVFIGAVCFLVGSALLEDFTRTALVFGVVLAGVPVYWICFGKRG